MPPGRSARRKSKREQKRLKAEAAIDTKDWRKRLSGEPKPESSDASREYITDDFLLKVPVSYRNRMLMLAAVETLEENNLLKEGRRIATPAFYYVVPEDKIEYLLKTVQTKSEVQMKSDIIGLEEVKQLEAAEEFIHVKKMFNELKQVEAAAQYIYAKEMFNVGIRGGKKFMEIPKDKARYVGPNRYPCYREPCLEYISVWFKNQLKKLLILS